MWKKGDIISENYEVLDIREGGFAHVYLCSDSTSKKIIAVKVLKAHYDQNNKICEGFRNEALTWIKLGSHQNIVNAYCVKLINHRIHIFLELIPGLPGIGPTLSDWIHIRNISLKEAMRIAYDICEGMIYAKKQMLKLGIDFVHQDLKPSNILITPSGTAKISDFGLVKHFIPSDTIYVFGKQGESVPFVGNDQKGGTPLYMAPEQFHREAKIDIRTDIYSFGCILYEMFTRKFANGYFDKNCILKVHRQSLDFLYSTLCIYIPNKIADIVVHCLHDDPQNRPQHFEQIRDMLQVSYYSLFKQKIQVKQKANDSTYKDKLLKGLSLFELGRFVDSIEYFTQITNTYPDRGDAWYLKAYCEYNGKLWDKAAKSANKALEIGLSDPYYKKNARSILKVCTDYVNNQLKMSTSKNIKSVFNDMDKLLNND